MFDIAELFLFDGLSKDDLNAVISSLPCAIHFNKGEYIFTHTQFSQSLGIILSGEARVNVPSEQDEGAVMKRLQEGDIFGAAALFDRDRYVTDIMAQKPCTVQFVPQKLLLEIFEKHPVTAINYIKALTSRIRFLNDRVGSLSGKDTLTKVRDYFAANADENGIVAIPKGMKELSKTLSIGRSSLYRAVEALESDGIIIKNGQNFIYRKENLK